MELNIEEKPKAVEDKKLPGRLVEIIKVTQGQIDNLLNIIGKMQDMERYHLSRISDLEMRLREKADPIWVSSDKPGYGQYKHPSEQETFQNGLPKRPRWEQKEPPLYPF